jgi:hypothetical protein
VKTTGQLFFVEYVYSVALTFGKTGPITTTSSVLLETEFREQSQQEIFLLDFSGSVILSLYFKCRGSIILCKEQLLEMGQQLPHQQLLVTGQQLPPPEAVGDGATVVAGKSFGWSGKSREHLELLVTGQLHLPPEKLLMTGQQLFPPEAL